MVGKETQKPVYKLVEMLAISTTPEMLAEVILKSSELKCAIKGIILKDIDEQCRKLCSCSPENSSILRVPRSSHKVSEKQLLQWLTSMNFLRPFITISDFNQKAYNKSICKYAINCL